MAPNALEEFYRKDVWEVVWGGHSCPPPNISQDQCAGITDVSERATMIVQGGQECPPHTTFL